MLWSINLNSSADGTCESKKSPCRPKNSILQPWVFIGDDFFSLVIWVFIGDYGFLMEIFFLFVIEYSISCVTRSSNSLYIFRLNTRHDNIIHQLYNMLLHNINHCTIIQYAINNAIMGIERQLWVFNGNYGFLMAIMGFYLILCVFEGNYGVLMSIMLFF